MLIKRKSYLVAIALVAFSGSAFSEDQCKKYGDFAANVMKARQDGMPMQDMISSDTHEFVKAVVIAAYERPRFSVQENKEKEIVDFQNQLYLECIKSR